MAAPAPPPPPQLQLAPAIVQWPFNVTRALIQQRQRHHQLFEDTMRHNPLWIRIANHV